MLGILRDLGDDQEIVSSRCDVVGHLVRRILGADEVVVGQVVRRQRRDGDR